MAQYLVTGVLGCIGAWTARALVQAGHSVTGLDTGDSRHRLELVLEARELALVEVIEGDITDLGALERTLADREITEVIHLAALQVPASRANPPLAAAVNVVGTTNVFEAIRRSEGRIRGVAYASSAAAYGPDDVGDEDERTQPDTIYGMTKVANESTARIYWRDHGVASVGFRPYVVYGPGRDAGVTAEPTFAMAAAARGEPYEIAFGGRFQIQLARDVADMLLLASVRMPDGAHVVNPGPEPVTMADVIEAITAVVPDARISFRDVQLPFPAYARPGAGARALGELEHTPLREGVRETIERFRASR